MTRAERYQQFKPLRDQGLLLREIAARYGCSYQLVVDVLGDPDGMRARARKKRAGGICVDCGGPTSYITGGTAKRCIRCDREYRATEEYSEERTRWTRERIIAAVQWWARAYGEPPAESDWNPYKARERRNEAQAARFERLFAQGRVPWFTSVGDQFGSWNAGITAAGFEPRPAYGVAENAARRRKKVAA